MAIDGDISGDARTIEYMRTLPDFLVDAVHDSIGVQTLRLQRRILAKVTGEVLRERTGGLRSALVRGTSVKDTGKWLIGAVGLAGASKQVSIYGATQEFGGVIPARIIKGLEAAKLRFVVGGRARFADFVIMPAVRIPEHSYLRTALNELRPSIEASVSDAATPTLNFV